MSFIFFQLKVHLKRKNTGLSTEIPIFIAIKMGCLRLTYQTPESPLKVVYRANGVLKKPVQRFMSLDPLMGKFPWMSPYVAFNNNPVMLVDRDGKEAKNPKDSKDPEDLSKREVRKIEKTAEKLNKLSNKLSEREHLQADKYQAKHGGEVVSNKDDHGNDRYSVRSNPKDGDYGISIKTFNRDRWSKLNSKTDGLVSQISGSMSLAGISGVRMDLMGITSGVSFIGDNGFVHTQFKSTFYLSNGEDRGWHQVTTTGTEMIGVNYEISAGVIYGEYMGQSYDMTLNSLSGLGYQAGGDILGGVNAWWAYGGNGNVGWVGSTITGGLSIGGCAGTTNTTIEW